uniref:Uncharacterized protein n=1 Tax=Anguilla anguilla TaxID=7936 RepID=A0A0E9XDQ1_ANGAN
MFRQENKIIL